MHAIPWEEFVRAHAPLSEGEFQAVVGVPHLLIPWSASGPESEDPFFTERISRADLAGSAERRRGADVVVVGLRKREQGNAFTSMVTVGRAANNDLVLPHAGVSKFHAYFRQVEPGKWVLRDANSLNGTRVDGERLSAERDHPLRAGSIVRLADSVTCEFLPPSELWRRLKAEDPLSPAAQRVAQQAQPQIMAEPGRATRAMPRQLLDPDEETHPLAP